MFENLAAIVWDFDGVINDTVRDGHPIWHRDIKADLGIDPEDMRLNFFIPHFQEIVVGKKDLKDTLVHVLPDIGFTGTVDDFIMYWFEKDLVLDNRILGLIDRTTEAGISAYLGTNQEPYRAAFLANVPDLQNRFQKMFVSGHLGVKKPDAEFFNHVQTEIGEVPERLLFIDDSLEHIKVARDLGWQAVHYRAFSDLPDSLVHLADRRP